MSRGGRRDIAVLKKLRDASASPSKLLQDGSGDSILEKANKISGFLNKQKSRTSAASNKTEWLIVYRHLQDEREAAERDLQACLLALADSKSPELSAQATDCLASARAGADASRTLRSELRCQLLAIARTRASLCPAHAAAPAGSSGYADDANGLRVEIARLREDLSLQLQTLDEEFAALTADVERAVSGAGAGPSTCGVDGTAPRQRSVLGGSAVACASSERERGELEAMLARHPLADPCVKARVRGVHAALAARFAERLDAWRADAEAAGGAAGAAGAPGATGGWSADEHSQFLKLRERYYREGAKGGTSRESALSRMASLLPGRNLAAVLHHDDWYVQHLLLSRRRRDISESWAREHRAFIDDSELFVEESAVAATAAAEAAADRLAHELRREAVGEELEAMRAQRQAMWEAGAEERAAKAAADAEMAALEAELAEAEARVRHERLAVYRLALEAQARERAAADAEAANAEKVAKAAAAAAAKPRLELRAAEQQLKAMAAAEAEATKARQAAERAARLDALRALVAPHIQADPARVYAPTVSSAAQLDEDEVAARSAAAAFQKVHGYTNKQLYSDPRFKIMDALQRQGLHTTHAGRAAINRAATVKATRPDNLTQVQLAAYSHK